MAGEATIQLSGFVHKAPELRFTNSGVAVLKLTVKVTPYNTRTQEKKEPSWYQVSVWREAAESATEVINEGDRVLVVGTLEMGSYEKDGIKRYVPEVTAYSIGVMPRKKETAKAAPTDDGSPW
jgi:single-strand DNA-binding protein